jgi:hypothetical protein
MAQLRPDLRSSDTNPGLSTQNPVIDFDVDPEFYNDRQLHETPFWQGEVERFLAQRRGPFAFLDQLIHA